MDPQGDQLGPVLDQAADRAHGGASMPHHELHPLRETGAPVGARAEQAPRWAGLRLESSAFSVGRR